MFRGNEKNQIAEQNIRMGDREKTSKKQKTTPERETQKEKFLIRADAYNPYIYNTTAKMSGGCVVGLPNFAYNQYIFIAYIAICTLLCHTQKYFAYDPLHKATFFWVNPKKSVSFGGQGASPFEPPSRSGTGAGYPAPEGTG